MLPSFEDFWSELPDLFEWLEGSLIEEELSSAPNQNEDIDAWSPPATAWTWGQGKPIESIRFAAANHLCVELGYLNSSRLIEPYALRRTRAGDFLLCAVKVRTRESRTYRVDRIQSIKVTTQPFKPVFKIEFSSSGPVAASPISRPTSTPSARRIAGVRHSGLVYVFKCPSCGKEFKRQTSDGSLRPHKGRGGWQCPSTVGYLVRTNYEH